MSATPEAADDDYRRGWVTGHAQAAVDAGIYELPEGETVASFVAGIRFSHGKPSRTKPVPVSETLPTARCFLCSREFKTVDHHEVCWICRADAREGRI